ncbi:hypothetical protein [Paraburkholderia fungorum]|jgi:hypothetical protein|uniref:Transmembrane protein n=1 Tax=Paraburkholderia fungorum TaxID=134537 RepID=A0AAW3V9P9_9BURK|nr:hypothetical protein [Paraburkholderia fungorum]MBB4519421.1 hypothetical protein [Paraburkholderia fungorum]MBB6207254.1 hypothetical protein [Paraburkholderia fungorum]
MNAGSRAFIFFTPGGGLIGALFCPAGDWKMATIAEIVFIGGDGCIHRFWVLLLSGEMCCFLHFMQSSFWLGFFGVTWRNVIGPCGAWGLGWVFSFSIYFVFMVYMVGVCFFMH